MQSNNDTITTENNTIINNTASSMSDEIDRYFLYKFGRKLNETKDIEFKSDEDDDESDGEDEYTYPLDKTLLMAVGETPLMEAARNNDFASAFMILKVLPLRLDDRGDDSRIEVDVDAMGTYSFELDIEYCHIHVLKLRIPPLLWACHNGNIKMAKLLIDNGADVNTAAWWNPYDYDSDDDYYYDNYNKREEDTPLTIACRNKNVELVRLLVENGANVNVEVGDIFDHQSPLHVVGGNIELARLLINAGADVNKEGVYGIYDDYYGTPLFQACGSDSNVDFIRLLIRNGADVNAEDNYGTTPLMKASRCGAMQIAQLLVDHRSQTSLDLMSYANINTETAKLLIKNGYNMDEMKLLVVLDGIS